MTFLEIENAIGQVADSATALPVAWPNRDYSGPVPYLEFRHSPNTVTDDSLGGTNARQDGIALITVVGEVNTFAAPLLALAQQVADAFPKALRIPAGSGNVLINTPSSVVAGFTDGVNYRVPVRISYETEG